MKAYERLLNYVKVPTPSDERSGTHPGNLPIQRHRACKSVNIQNLWEMRSN